MCQWSQFQIYNLFVLVYTDLLQGSSKHQEAEAKMGKKLDALLGRTFKTSKFKSLAKLAISRIAILKKQRQVRFSHARSDVIQLLNLGHQERALLRVEHVIKEQNMLDVFVMIEGYCNLLIERVVLIQNNKECPNELKEAVSSLLFAASRCGEFPELQHIRKIFVSWFGKDFAASAAELWNNCGVNPKIIKRLSARQLGLESRLEVLKEIASENGITLHLKEDMDMITEVGQQGISPHLEGDASVIDEQKLDADKKQEQLGPNKSASLDDPEIGDDTYDIHEEIKREDKFSESLKARKKYRDVAAAAQEAFESAAYAAVAARAAVELSRSESQDKDPDDHNNSNHQQGILSDSDSDSDESSKSKLHIDSSADSGESNHSNNGLGFGKIYPIDNCSSESEAEEMAENNYRIHFQESEESKKKEGTKRTLYASGSDSYLGYERKSSLPSNEFSKIRTFSAVAEEDLSDENGNEIHYQSPKWIPLKSQADPMAHSFEGRSRLESTHFFNSEKQLHSQHSNIDRNPVSVRTRKVHRG